MADGMITLFDKDVAVAIDMVFSKKYDPKDSIFASAAPIAPSAPSSQPQPQADISGAWSIRSLFDIPFPQSPYSLNITSTTITLKGGCNTYTYPYTVTPQVQVISLGKPTMTEKACQNSDDQLYVSGIEKMYKYLESSTPNGRVLNFYDEKGNIGYALEIRKQGANSAFGNSVAVAPQP